MISFLKKIIGVSILFCCTFVLTAQQYLSIPVTNNMKYYEGRIDDLNDVKINLNCNKGECLGELVYLRSGDRFNLRGQQEDNQIVLEEYDQYQQLSGLLTGEFIGNSLVVSWENIEQTIGSNIYLKEVTSLENELSNCADNKWIQSYKGEIDNREVEMVLQKTASNRIEGTAYFVKDKKPYIIRGEVTGNNNLHLNLFDTHTQRALGSIRAIYRNSKALSASFYDANNAQSSASFELVHNTGINCMEYADYYSTYDFLYPHSEDPLFNHIMTFLTKDWMANCKSKANLIRKERATPPLRASQRGYTWTEVNFYSNDFISGLLTHDNTWEGNKSTKAFNYDFASRASVELEDIFKAGFDYDAFIKEYIHSEFKENVAYKSDVSFQAWLNQQNFKLFTVGREGLHFFSNFHIVYGRQSVLIPYKKIKSNIKKKSTIRRLF